MVINLLRYCRGYVEFTAKGQFTERFLNLTIRKGINLWNYKGEKNCLTACVTVKEYKMLPPLAKKANIKLRHHKKLGLPFVVNNNKGKAGLVAGMAVGLIIMYVLSGFIWSVEVEGTNRLSTHSVQTALEENGLYVGAYKGNISIKKLERDLTLSLQDIGWLTVNITGTDAKISMSESMELDNEEDLNAPCNLKSTESGQIIKMKIKQGANCVNVGDGVAKNQLLVSGVIKPEEGAASFVHSSGSVIAQIVKEKQFSVPTSKTVTLPTGNYAEKSSVNFMGVLIPTSFFPVPNDSYILNCEREKLLINNVSLPIQRKLERWYEYNQSEYTLTEDECKSITKTEMLLYEAFNEQNSNIIERKIKEGAANNSYTLQVVYTYQKDIAKQVEIGIAD